jgi:hypothetical protein
MADFGTDMQGRIRDLARSEPIIAAQEGISKVGAMAQDLYERGKAKARQVMGSVAPARQATQPLQTQQRSQAIQTATPQQARQVQQATPTSRPKSNLTKKIPLRPMRSLGGKR